MRILIWQWGRFGAGPLFAAQMAEGLRSVPGVHVSLSLSRNSDLMRNGHLAGCEVPVDTYSGVAGWAWQVMRAPFSIVSLARRFQDERPDVAICAMPGPLDLLPVAALRRLGVPIVVLVHDAHRHPGDNYPLVLTLQRQLLQRADGIVTLSRHVAKTLIESSGVEGRRIRTLWHPPFHFGSTFPPPRMHGGPLRLLFFGRLRSYKGLHLLHAAVSRLEKGAAWELRVVGSGAESRELQALRKMERVQVENRWVPDSEIGDLITWSDVVVLPYVEASQSGIAPVALAAGRYVVATRVGGLPEQLGSSALASLCEPDADSLAAGLRRLIDNPAMPSHGEIPLQGWPEFGQALVEQVCTLVQRTSEPAGAARPLAAPPNAT